MSYQKRLRHPEILRVRWYGFTMVEAGWSLHTRGDWGGFCPSMVSLMIFLWWLRNEQWSKDENRLGYLGGSSPHEKQSTRSFKHCLNIYRFFTDCREEEAWWKIIIYFDRYYFGIRRADKASKNFPRSSLFISITAIKIKRQSVRRKPGD